MPGNQVVLYTDDGWNLKVDRDDPLLSDIFAPYEELGEEASEIPLSGSVAEVFEREYLNVSKVLKYYKELEDIREEMDQVPSTGNARNELYHIEKKRWSILERLQKDHITLDKIRHIVRILNMPQGWEEFVGVNPDDREYYSHLDAVITIISKSREHRLHQPIINTTMPINPRVRSVSGILNTVEISRDAKIGVYNVSEAIINNFYLVEYRIEGTLYEFDWEDVIRVYKHYELDVSDELNNAFLTYSGKGDYSEPGAFAFKFVNYVMITKKNDNAKRIAKLTIKYDKSVARYYKIAIDSFPEDIDLYTLGLRYLLEPRSIKKTYVENASTAIDRPANQFTSIVTWVNQNLSLIAYENAMKSGASGKALVKKHLELFAEYVEDYLAGRKGLIRILIASLHELEKTPEHNPKYAILSELTDILEKRSEKPERRSEPLNEFPVYVL